jgi:DNA replication and repair protein RecF
MLCHGAISPGHKIILAIFANYQSYFMYLKSLTLLQFKNYKEASLEFIPKINCFAGDNGSGKTNLLDAIYYLSFCKSFSNPVDSQNILFDNDFFVIQGQYKVNGSGDELYCGVKRGQRKIFKRNKKEYERLSDHIGSYPLVLIYPGDVQLIHGGSDDRRKFLDGVISQNNKEYLQRLLDYNKALMQRNSLLKYFAERRSFDEASLEIWDEQLIVNGNYIFEERKIFFDKYRPVFKQCYNTLTGKAEETDIEYESQLHQESFGDMLLNARKKDLAAQHTTIGIHKDNLGFLLNDQVLKKFGSQGQQKSFVIALKLAQFHFTKNIKGFNPILLFDDIFDKLDPRRVELLIKMVSDDSFGQVFITDTHTSRLEEIFRNVKETCRIFDIEPGRISGTRIIGLQNG